jgi:hypothetical protein
VGDMCDNCGEAIEWWRSHTELRSSRWVHSKTQQERCEHAYATPAMAAGCTLRVMVNSFGEWVIEKDGGRTPLSVLAPHRR